MFIKKTKISRNGKRQSALRFSRALGWFSILSGVIEMLAPRRLFRRMGMRRKSPVVTGYGVREVVTGTGILSARNPVPWIWARVAGDVLDLAALAFVGRGMRKPAARRGVILAIAAVAGIALVDVICARRLAPPRKTMRDYSDRSGFPRAPNDMRGAWLARRSRPQRQITQSWVRAGIERFSAPSSPPPS